MAIPDDHTRGSDADSRLLLLGCLLFVAGSAVFYMFPPYLAQIGGRFSLNPAQLGTLAAVESLGIGISSLFGPLWISRFDHRACAILGILVCVLGNVATALAGSYQAVLAARLALGLFGEGVLLTLSFTVLCLVRNVDRGFAIALTSAVSFGAAVIASAAALQRFFPTFGTLAPLIGIAVATLSFVGWFSLVRTPAAPTAAPRGARNKNGLVILALTAQAVWFGAPGAFWTFAEQVATDKGVAPGSTELALSIGELTSLLGSLVAALLGHRWGRLGPITAATAGIVLTAVLYQMCRTPLEVCLVLSAFYSLWNYGTVYQMSLVSSLDEGGKLAVVMPAAQVFGLSIGPLVAGNWMGRHGDAAVAMATATFAVLGVGLYLVTFYRVLRARRSSSAVVKEAGIELET
jgi:MFS transporter, DHA1 family, inner membrane transport protein